jgi:hypothetical protein
MRKRDPDIVVPRPFNLIVSDVGRLIRDITPHLRYADLERAHARSWHGSSPKQHEVETDDGHVMTMIPP